MPPRTCPVSFTDSRGIRHEAVVQAESLFEATASAMSAFRQNGWLEEQPGPATRFQVEVREPVVRHLVTVKQLQNWAQSTR